MVLPPSPLPFCSLRRSRALHCRGWLSRPHPRQLPPRVPMPQTATPLSTLLPLRRLLLSLSPPPPLPSMPPPPPLALVTRSADWTLWTEWEGIACLPFLLSSFRSLVRHNVLRHCYFSSRVVTDNTLCPPSFFPSAPCLMISLLNMTCFWKAFVKKQATPTSHVQWPGVECSK